MRRLQTPKLQIAANKQSHRSRRAPQRDVAIGAARRRKAPQGASASGMLKYAANDNLQETPSRNSTIGPPLILAVPTVGNVIDKERANGILKERGYTVRGMPLVLAVRAYGKQHEAINNGG